MSTWSCGYASQFRSLQFLFRVIRLAREVTQYHVNTVGLLATRLYTDYMHVNQITGHQLLHIMLISLYGNRSSSQPYLVWQHNSLVFSYMLGYNNLTRHYEWWIFTLSSDNDLPGTILLTPVSCSASLMLNTRVFLTSSREGMFASLLWLWPSESHCSGVTFFWTGVGGSLGETNSLNTHPGYKKNKLRDVNSKTSHN